MASRNANPHVRRGIGTLAVVLMLATLLVPAPAEAYTYSDWSGSFVSATADAATVGLDEYSIVRFGVSQQLRVSGTRGGYVRIYDQSGTSVKTCSSGEECLYYVNPKPGATDVFTAELRTMRDGETVVIDTAGPVAVTDRGWEGALTHAFADNPLPALSEYTAVRFGVSEPLSYARIAVTDQDGQFVKTCTSGDECVVGSNPAPGATETYHALLRVQLNGQWVDRSTATVSVTDVGYQGGFTSAYAVDPTPALSQSTIVHFDLSMPLEAAKVVITDEDGRIVATCGSKSGTTDSCATFSNPAPGETKTYTASLTVQGANSWFEKDTATVSVTDPGWRGSIGPAATNTSFVEAEDLTTVLFDVSAALESARVDVYVDGDYEASCSGSSKTSCGVFLRPSEDSIHVVEAEVYASGVNDGILPVASASQVVTTLSANAFAELLLTATPVQLEAALGTVLATEVAELQQATRGPSFCLSLGQTFPTYRLRMTIPDLTAVCTAGTVAVIAYLLKEVGFDATLQGAHVAADNPANLDPSDPNYPAGGGLNPDGTQCHQYDFDGNCIEGLEVDPEPALQVAADGARIPPSSNCLSDSARDQLIDEMSIRKHHIITRYANQAPEGADDVQLEREANVDRLQALIATYGFGINAAWNILEIPHAGPHPSGYHAWVWEQADAIDRVAQGDPTVFLALWKTLMRDVIATDPTIVRNAYWSCYG